MAKRCPSCGYGPIGPFIDNCPMCAEPVRNVRSDAAAPPLPAKQSPWRWLPWGVAGSIIAVVGILGCCGFGMSRLRNAVQDAPPPIERARPGAVADGQVPIAVAVALLVQEFQKDPDAADQKYRGQALELTGVVERGGRGRDDIPFVILHAGDENAKLKIECFFDSADEESEARILRLRKGQTITVRGEYDGRVSNLQLGDCVLVK